MLNKIVFKIFIGINIFTFPLYSNPMFEPIPLSVTVNKAKVDLGKKLFNDTLLSFDNTISCATCHNLKHNGAETKAVSQGIDGKFGTRNSPTIFNSRYNFAQFWDGSARDLKHQALAPMENPVEMGDTLENVIKKLKQNNIYVSMFKKVYNSEINSDNMSDAIAEYEKTLITPNSRFDKYLRGDKNILTTQELKGLNLFKSKGCVSCHNGINIGGNLYQKLGYFADLSNPRRDLGRYNITKNDIDKDNFKVPSLRNIAITAPYFHNGEVKTLEKAVKTMIAYQLGRITSDEEIDSIVAFLKTLTGELPSED